MQTLDELDQRTGEPPSTPTAIAQAVGRSREIRVLIGDWEISARQAKYTTPLVRARIESARKHGLPAWCFCTGSRLALVPHAGEKRPPYLSALRDQGYLHEDCYFGETSTRPASAVQVEHRPGHRLDNGKIQVSLTLPLSSLLGTSDGSTKGGKKTRSGDRTDNPLRLRAAPLGLTLGLIEEGGMNVWDPSVHKRRTWSDTRKAMELAATNVQVGTIPLNERLLMRSGQWERISASLQAGRRTSRIERAIAIGEVETLVISGATQALRLKDVDVPLQLPRRVWERTQRSFRRIAPLLNQASARRHVLAVVMLELGTDDEPQACRLDLLLTSEQYIPCDSRQEVLVVNRLVSQGRWFMRPIFFEPDEVVLPDIILLDVAEPLPMEIFAFWTAEYKQRTEVKLAFYESSGRPYWAWDVERQVEMPDFPPKQMVPTINSVAH